MTTLKIKLLDSNAVVPTRKRNTDAGYDLYSVENKHINEPGKYIIDLGIAIMAPPGYYYTLDGRSGLSTHSIFPFRAIIDATYTGRLYVVLYNLIHNNFNINIGNRIAQLTLHKIKHVDFEIVDEFEEMENQRNQLGWGSSGI